MNWTHYFNFNFLQTSWTRTRYFASVHKFWSAVIGLVLVLVLWIGYSRLTAGPAIPSYVVAQAQTGTLIVSVTGTGQVSAQNTLSLSPEASGKIVYIGVKDGQQVAAGQLIAEVDPTQAQKAVRDAEANFQAAEIAMQKLQEPADALSTAQAQNAVVSGQNSLTSAYSHSTSDLASTFLNLPNIMSGLQDVDFGTETNKSQQWNMDFYENALAQYTSPTDAQPLRDSAFTDYQAAKASYDAVFNDYKAINLTTASTSTIEGLVTETYNSIILAQNAVKSSNALIQHYSDQLTQKNQTTPSITTTELSSLASYTNNLSTYSTNLLSDTTSIQNDKQTLQQNTLSLAKLKQGADTLDLQSEVLNVQKAQNALQDAKDNLSNDYVTAPFPGTIALSVTPYQQVGSGTTVATLVTSEQLAEITLNEVDAATLKVGDPAMLTFDAIPDLTIAGQVADISPVGTVSQGVVSYTVKIGFATQDTRIKPGMSVSAAIDTAIKQNALTIPGSAVHQNSDDSSYVLVFNPPLNGSGTQGISSTQTPEQLSVTTGLSNDTSTEITSGLKDGQQVVVRSVSAKTTITSSAPSLFGAAGGGGARTTTSGAGAARTLGR
jgi:RND family efflux transporter MFP subunit